MEDVARLDHLLECLHELNWVEDHLAQSLGGVHDRLEEVREQVRSEILSILQSTTSSDPNLAN
jgi:hypothetical protein